VVVDHAVPFRELPVVELVAADVVYATLAHTARLGLKTIPQRAAL
jgi:hypothetical protein